MARMPSAVSAMVAAHNALLIDRAEAVAMQIRSKGRRRKQQAVDDAKCETGFKHGARLVEAPGVAGNGDVADMDVPDAAVGGVVALGVGDAA